MTLQVSRILHAGYVFSCEGVDIVFDPIVENPFSRNCHAFPDVRFDLDAVRELRLAAVFISHYHDDHCSFDSLALLARDTPIYMYCLFEEMFDMLRDLGFTHVVQLRTNVAVQVGPFSVTPREALDADVDAMFQIRAGGMNVLNVVDGCIPSDMATGTQDELEEERRLLYVAMTRAREHLHLIVPHRFYVTQQGSGGDRHIYAGRTRFITEAIAENFERITWPEAGGPDANGGAKPAAPLLQVRDRARAAWR